MSRPKSEVERNRSIRIPCSEDEFAIAHALAGKVPIAVYLRDLIEAEAKRHGVKVGKKGTRR